MKLLIMLFLNVALASEPKKFMYHDHVTFSDDFYGDCRGVIVMKNFDTNYWIDATCSKSGKEVLNFRLDASMLTKVK